MAGNRIQKFKINALWWVFNDLASLIGEPAIGAEALVVFVEGASGPVSGEGRIRDDGFGAQVGVLGRGMLQRVLVLQVEAPVALRRGRRG